MPRPFGYENRWGQEADRSDLIKLARHSPVHGVPTSATLEKIHRAKASLSSWSKHKFRGLRAQILQNQKLLLNEQLNDSTDWDMEGIARIKANLNDLLKKEEAYRP
ncbi:hypothetical protein Droror1_Dr00002344 [Drosera rotundifolia]